MKTVLNGKRSSRGARRAAWQAFVMAGLVLGVAAACERVATAPGADRSGNEVSAADAGSIGGTVVSLDGKPVAGAVVTTPDGQTAITDADGSFTIKGLAPAERLPVDVSARDFASTVRIYRVVPGEELSREIRLIPQGDPVTIVAGEGGEVRFSDEGVVEVPANAFAGVSPEEPVIVRVSYFDPADAEAFREAPGDFSGIEEDGSPSVLSSNGMFSVSATNARGEELSLAEGRALRISVPDRVGGGSQPEVPCRWGVYRWENGRWVWLADTGVRVLGQEITYLGVQYNVDCRIPSSYVVVRAVDAAGNAVRNLSVTASALSYFGGAESWTNAEGLTTLPLGAGQQVSVRAGSRSVTLTTPPEGSGGEVTTLVF